MPPRRRSRHLPPRGALWPRRRAWAALGITCLLLGGAGAALALFGPEARLWQGGSELGAYYVTEAQRRESDMPPLVPQPLPPLHITPRLPTMQEQELAPESVELSPMVEEPLPVVQSSLLIELPPQDLSSPAPMRKSRPVVARQAAPASISAAAEQVAAAPAAEGEFTPPAYRSAPRPPYPAAMRQSRVEGSVRLRIYLDAEGAPQRVDIIAGSGHTEFDTTAREWVLSHWRFTPARQGGRPVPGSVVTSVQFVFSG